MIVVVRVKVKEQETGVNLKDKEMKKVPTTVILGVLSLCELFTLKSMGYSCFLWICHGLYKADY